MLIGSTLRVVLLSGSGALLCVAVAFMAIRKRKSWAAIGIGALAVAIGVWAFRHSLVVLVVTDGDHGPRVERKLASSIDEPVAPGAQANVSNPIVDSLWLINRSSTTVRVESFFYSTSSSDLDEPPVVFPPNTSGAFYNIEYIGPKHRPPKKIVGNALTGEARNWLTW